MQLKYLVSACLAGQAVRYDATSNMQHVILQLMQTHDVVTACPEMLGGLSCPRFPAEIQNGQASDVLTGSAQVKDILGVDVSAEFIAGAQRMLALAQQHKVDVVVLKDNSPSCGTHYIYDGTFTRTKIHGHGVTAALLKQHGFQVISEQDFIDLVQDQL